MIARALAVMVAAAALSFTGVSAQHVVHAAANGTYDLQIDLHGQAQSAVLTITADKDKKLGGTLTVHDQEFKLESVTLKEHDMIVRATMPHGALTLTLTFKSADELAGPVEVEGMGTGTATGTRRKA